eukprot:scaffold2858_cov245-Ochromonas_danica.AAC.5
MTTTTTTTTTLTRKHGPMSDLLHRFILQRLVIVEKFHRRSLSDGFSSGRRPRSSSSRRTSRSSTTRVVSSRSDGSSTSPWITTRSSTDGGSSLHSEDVLAVYQSGRLLVQSAGEDHREIASILSFDSSLAFDRLIEEQVITMNELPGMTTTTTSTTTSTNRSQTTTTGTSTSSGMIGSTTVLIIQVLYGCSDQKSLLLTSTLGAPKAALRYINSQRLRKLQSGLTIAIYDFSSRVSRALYMPMKEIIIFLHEIKKIERKGKNNKMMMKKKNEKTEGYRVIKSRGARQVQDSQLPSPTPSAWSNSTSLSKPTDQIKTRPSEAP